MVHNTTTPQPRETHSMTDTAAITRSMLIVMFFTMVGKATGFVREVALASRFGANEATDAIKTAIEAPNFFLSIFVVALAAALIPAYSKKLSEGKAQADRFMSSVVTLGLLASFAVLSLTYAFIGPIVRGLILPHATESTQQLTIDMARVLMPIGIFLFLSRMVTAYLQANFSFAVPALSQIFLNIVTILAIMLSKGSMMVVAVGTLIGWFMQLAVQLPRLSGFGYRYKPSLDVKELLHSDVLVLMLPLLATGAFDQIYIIIRAMASDMAGHITVLDYSMRLTTLVSAALLTTIATVLYPSLVRHVSEKERFCDNLSFGINLNLLIAIPASAALIALSVPVIRLVYERGQFTSADTQLTAQTLAMSAIGILGLGLRELLTRAFFAHKDVNAPTVVGVLTVVSSAALSFLLYPTQGAPGIAAATALSAALSSVVLAIILQKRHQAIDGARVWRCLWKVSVSSAAMCAVLVFLKNALRVLSLTGMPFLLAMLSMILIGVAVYLFLLYALRTEELRLAAGFARQKLQRKAAKGADEHNETPST